MGAEMTGGRHGIFAAGLARRALRDDRGGCDLRSRNSNDRTAPAHREPVDDRAERSAFEDRFSIMRRLILAFDVAVLAVLGYWVGDIIGGKMFGAAGG
jgi:hypothetical protein